MSSRAPIPLSELNVEAFPFTEAGVHHDAILFDCPLEGCKHEGRAHGCLVPYSQDGGKTAGGRLIWTHVSGDGLDTITLSPSYRIIQPCDLHGWVRNGHWHFC